MYDLETFPLFFRKPAECFRCELIVADVEFLEFGPVLLGYFKGALVTDMAVTHVELLQP